MKVQEFASTINLVEVPNSSELSSATGDKTMKIFPCTRGVDVRFRRCRFQTDYLLTVGVTAINLGLLLGAKKRTDLQS